MKRLRVLQVVADGAPGGGTTAVLGLCEDLLASGSYDVSLVTQQGSYALERAAAMGLENHGIDFFSSRFDFSIPARLARIVAGWRPGLIHLHGGRAAHSFCLPPLRSVKIPTLYTVHGFHFPAKRLPLRWMALAAEKRIANRVGQVIYVSESDRRLARKHSILPSSPGRSRIIYNGIHAEELDRVRPRPHPEERQYDIVFAGRMHRQKNPLFMMEIMAALQGTGATLLMIGGGEYRERVEARARELGVAGQVTFTGALPREETLGALRAARVFVLPSLWEGMPIALMEALYYGVPVVASRIRGTEEIIENGKTGLLLEEFDARLYAAAITRLLEEDALHASMSAAGREDARRRFLRGRSSAATMEAYNSMAAPFTIGS